MTKQELKAKIDKLENGIKSKATPSNLIAPLKAQKAKLEKELQDMEAAEKKAVKTKKVSKVAEKIKAAKKSVAKKTPAKAPAKEERKKDNIVRDGDRKSLPAGKRISKTGKVYYEMRANRTDKQTSRKPYLADGGKLANGKYKYEKGDEGMFQGDEVRVVKYTTSYGGTYEYNIIDENGKIKTHGAAKAEKFENQFRYFPKMAKGGKLFIPYVGDIDDFLLKSLLQKNSVVKNILGTKEMEFLNDSNTDVIGVSGKNYDFIVTDGEKEFEFSIHKNGRVIKTLRPARPQIVEHYKTRYDSKMADGGELTEKKLLVLKADDEKGGNVFVSEEVVKVKDLDDAKSKVKEFVSKYNLDDKTFTGGRYFKLVKTSKKMGNVTSSDVKSEELGTIDYKGNFKSSGSKMANGGETDWGADLGGGFSIGNDVYITDSKSLFQGKTGFVSGSVGRDLLVTIMDNGNERSVVVSKKGVEKLDAPEYVDGGNIKSENELKNKNMNYGYGGKTKSRKSMKDLTIEQISSMTGVGKAGIERFSDDNNLSEDDLSNIMQGLGRRMISASDFATAVSGNKDNQYTKEIVDFAKSGKGYKMAKGGEVKKHKVVTSKESYANDLLKYADLQNIPASQKMVGNKFIVTFDSIPKVMDSMTQDIKNLVNKMADGGKVDKLEYESILGVLKEKIDESIEELPSDYQTAAETFKGEEVEHESRDGFIAYTDGGYEARWFDNISNLNGSGISLPTMGLDAEMQRQVDYNYELAKDRFKDEYPEIVEELGEDNIDYNSLQDSGYDDEAEQLSEWEMNYDGDDTIMMEIGAFYYSPINYRASENKHTIFLFANVNLESPYHRSGNLEDGIDHTFTFDSLDELKEKMDENLKKIIDWFDGKNYKEGKKDLKITRMAKGGYMADGGMMDVVNAEISTIRRNIMGTTSFMMKIKGMRNPQDFSVYPISADQSGQPIKIQSATRFGFLDLSSGRGLMSQSHPNGAYSYHFTADKKVPFKLSGTDLQRIKEHISGTAGSSVGNMGISSDNSGASMMAQGGEVKKVTDGDDTYYLTYIDSTHFYLSNSKDYKGNAFHIAEFRSRPFYDEVKSWLKSYKGEMMSSGGETSGYSYGKLKGFESQDWEKMAREYAGSEWNNLSKNEKDEIISDLQKDWNRNTSFAHGGEVPAHFGSGRNIDVFGYQTQNFDICGTAVKEFEAAVEIMQNAKESEKESLARCAKYVDGLFGIEKLVVENSSADDANFYEAVSDIMSASIYNYRAEMSINLFSFVPQHLKEIAVRMAKAEKGGFYALGGMTAGRWYRDKSGEEFKFIGKIDSGENKGKFLFTDGQKSVYKDLEDFEDGKPKETKLFGFFEDGGYNSDKYIVKQAKDGSYKVVNTEIGMYVDYSFKTKADAEDFKREKDMQRKRFGRESYFEDGGYMADGGTIEMDEFYLYDENGKKYEFYKKEGDKYMFSSYKVPFGKALTIEKSELQEKIKEGKYKVKAYGGYMADGGVLEGLSANIYRSQYDSPTNKLYGKKGVIIVDKEVPKIFDADESTPAVKLVRRKLPWGDYIHAIPYDQPEGAGMFGGTFIYSSDSRFPSKYPIPLHDRVEMEKGGYMAKGGEVKVGDVYERKGFGKLKITKIDDGKFRKVYFKYDDNDKEFFEGMYGAEGKVANKEWVKVDEKMAKGGMTRKGGQPFEVEGRKFFYHKDDGNVYDSNHRLYAGSYSSLELAKKSLEKNFENIKTGNFYKDGGYMAKGGEIAFDNSNLYLNGFGMDSNGNSVVKVSFPNQRAFSIQTNGVLKETNNLYTKNIKELTEAQIKTIEKEVVDYIKQFGSKEQKQRLKTYSGYMAKGGSLKDRSERDSIKLSKEYQKVLDSNFDDKVYEKYQKLVKETQIPKDELQKIEQYVMTTPKGQRRDIDIYKYWGVGKMADGGKVKFADKVKSVQESLLKRKKVAPQVQKDYGKTYSKAEAKESAQRIVGSRMAQLKEKMAKKKK